jgi:hypothetical protein
MEEEQRSFEKRTGGAKWTGRLERGWRLLDRRLEEGWRWVVRRLEDGWRSRWIGGPENRLGGHWKGVSKIGGWKKDRAEFLRRQEEGQRLAGREARKE